MTKKETREPKKIGPVKIEWNWDLDEQYIDIEGDRFQVKGRCRHCWGGLIAKSDLNKDAPTAIRCRVCDILLEDDAAEQEYRGMSAEQTSNAFNMAFGMPFKYRDGGRFVNKMFPHIAREPGDKFRQRIEAEASKPAKEGWLNRREFPPGSPGFLVLQAKALMSGVERLPREMSVARFPDADLHDDGSVTFYWSEEELGEHPLTREYELMKRIGSVMTIAMIAAFACELAMKAIRLTRMDEARKSHDLWRLYRDLPADSQTRIETDYPEVVSVLEHARHTFGRWRYFEANLGDHGTRAMIDAERAFALAKTARVLLDEAEMMGLGYSVNLKARQKVTKIDDDRQHVHVIHDVNTKGTEAPPQRK